MSVGQWDGAELSHLLCTFTLSGTVWLGLLVNICAINVSYQSDSPVQTMLRPLLWIMRGLWGGIWEGAKPEIGQWMQALYSCGWLLAETEHIHMENCPGTVNGL